MTKKDPTWAELLGQGAAYVQNGMDRIAEWGFAQMKKASAQQPPKKKTTNKYVRMAKDAGIGALHFLGTFGDEYYKQYEKLKKERKQWTIIDKQNKSACIRAWRTLSMLGGRRDKRR